MSLDVKQLEGNWPPAQKESPQPKYKTLDFIGEIEDDLEDFCKYKFTGNYYEFDRQVRFVELKLSQTKKGAWFPVMDESDWLWVLKEAIREELNTDYTIIFETQIELK